MISAKNLLRYAWLILLGCALGVAALSTDRRVRQVEEYPCCCDPFGYLQMANDIRRGNSSGTGPQFTFESEHTRRLIDLMKSHQVPVPLWEHVVAPLAYHYFPKVDRVGVQYPPGVGLALALFPQDRALHGLGQVTILIFLTSGVVLLVLAAIRKVWVGAGLFVLALVFGLDVLARIDNASFSINAMLAPLLVCGLCLFAAFSINPRGGRWLVGAWLLIFLAGLLFGFAVLVRLPILFLMPGILLLLWNGTIRNWLRSGMPPFMLGAIVGGAVPLMIYQYRATGSWYSTTYPSYDNVPPSLTYISSNFSYYFGAGKASTFLWALAFAVIGWFGFYLWTRQSARPSYVPAGSPSFLPKLTWARVVVSALLLWGITLVYNLTHSIAGHYYPIPATFATVLLLGLSVFAFEGNSVNSGSSRTGAIRIIGLVLALIPAVAVARHIVISYSYSDVTRVPPRFELAAELADERAWIWADHLSGTIWYYTGRPAHKLTSTNRETRELIYDFMKKSDEPHFIVADAANATPVLDEIKQLGGKIRKRGEVEGYPYYLIEWPNAPANQKS